MWTPKGEGVLAGMNWETGWHIYTVYIDSIDTVYKVAGGNLL